jgi:hypothetical protein
MASFSITSAINLIEEQFDAGLKGVFTVKFNQDPFERLICLRCYTGTTIT